MPAKPGECASRTHEPSLRELTANLDGLRELLLSKLEAAKEVSTERDRLYAERDAARRAAVDAALVAMKEQTSQSFAASEKAIVKAEEAQHAYNVVHNDLARKMDDQNKATMPRMEIEGRFAGLDEKISTLRELASVGAGISQGGKGVKDESRANIAIALSFISLVALLWRLLGGSQ